MTWPTSSWTSLKRPCIFIFWAEPAFAQKLSMRTLSDIRLRISGGAAAERLADAAAQARPVILTGCLSGSAWAVTAAIAGEFCGQ
jgi:hypothetical protein